MDWDKLRIFQAVAKAGSFTGAGEILNLSQSAVSRQISTLEDSLGLALFHRHARGLLLTEQGEILQKAANDIANQLQVVEGKLSDTNRLPEGPLVVTISDFIGTTWLAPRLKSFRDLYPDIQLTLLFDERIYNIGMREADAAIRLDKTKHSDVISRHLNTINFHICASKNYLKQNGTPKRIEDLKEHCLITYPPEAQSPVREPGWLMDIAGVSRNDSKILLMSSMYAIHTAVKTDVGIAVLPDYLINTNDDLEVIIPECQRPSVDMFLVYAEERRDSKRINTFREFLLKSIDETPF